MPDPARTLGLGPLGWRLVLAFSAVSLVAVTLLVVAAQQGVDRGLTLASGGGRWAIAEDLAELAATAYSDAADWDGADLGPVLDAAARYGVLVVVRDASGVTVVESAGPSDHAPRAGGGVTVAVTVPGEGGAAGGTADDGATSPGSQTGRGGAGTGGPDGTGSGTGGPARGSGGGSGSAAPAPSDPSLVAIGHRWGVSDVGAQGSQGAGDGAGRGAAATATGQGDQAEEVVVGSVTTWSNSQSEVQAQAAGRDVAWSWILGAAAISLLVAVLAGWLVTRSLTRPLVALTAVTRAFAAGDRDARADESGTGELGEVARGFNEAVASAERSARQRRQMAADVAHELRTPLAALQAGLEEVRDGLVPADQDTLSRLHDQSVRLGRVVADLGLLASVEDAPLGLARGRADLARIAADEVLAREPELRGAGIDVREVTVEPVEVVADRDRLHQVVGNILANCARHCRPGDTVDVVVRRDGADAVLRVADTGPGIAAEDLPRVFDRYWRGPDGGVTGSGLGLAVVREIVTAHRGTVEVTSPAGAGTVVEVRLPGAGSSGGPA